MKEKKTRLWEKFFIAPSFIPNFSEVRYSIRTLSANKKLVLLGLLVIFSIGAIGLFYKINKHFSVEVPLQNGTLREGVIGSPYFINPLIAISDVDRDMTNLVYSGLLRWDGKNTLIPDLAEKYEIGDKGLSYTFFLRPNITWHDGKSITVDDVIFTIQRVKAQALKSPKRANWEGVEVEKIDDKTVRFLLKRPYAPFLENATLGIIPKHIWEGVAPEQMSLSEYNIYPVGSGPYKVERFSKSASGVITSYALRANDDFTLGAPYLKWVIINFYPSEESLLNAYRERKIDSLSVISPKNLNLLKTADVSLKTLMLPRIFGVFFNQNVAPVFANPEVRKALDLAVDKGRIVREILSGYGTAVNSPIPPGTFGAISTETAPPSPDGAKSILEKAGWKYNEKEKVYEKKGKKKTVQLALTLATSNTDDLINAAKILKETWEAIGAKVDIKIFEISDLEQNIIRPRNYEALLFGEIAGHDPDPFAFWHSSQRNDPGLNIALYTNMNADKILEDARQLVDAKAREEKYRLFQEEVKKDNAAVFLYAPYYLYLVPEWLRGVDIQNIASPSERFSQIHKWYQTTHNVWRIFVK